MTDHFCEFPFDEIRQPSGDFFDTWQQVKDAGFDDDQIWSVVVAEDTWSFGPPHHWVNLMGYVATKERHDGETYYHEDLSELFDRDEDGAIIA